MPHSNRKSDAGRGRSRPISSHPAFPAIVALWFAALTGIGSMALRPALLEGVVQAFHIDAIVPAAAPPLGATFRLLLALAIGVAGGIVGWIAAKRIAGPQPAPRRPVINVAEDFEAKTFDESLPWPSVQMPVADTGAKDTSEIDEGTPGKWGEAIAPSEIETPQSVPEPAAISSAEDSHVGGSTLRAAPDSPTGAERIASAELDALSHVELVERLAIAIHRRQARRDGNNTAPALPDPVIRFPDQQDRQAMRRSMAADVGSSQAQTEQALRQALAQLQRMSGGS